MTNLSRRNFLATIPLIASEKILINPLERKFENRHHLEKKRTNTILEASSKIFPKSIPYLELIEDIYNNQSNPFLPPLEYIIGLITQESAWNTLALSNSFAVGLMQFIRGTAIDSGLKPYFQRDFPELFKLEQETGKIRTRANSLRSTYLSNLSQNQFEELKRNKINHDKILAEWRNSFKKYRELYEKEIRNPHFIESEERFNSKLSISAGMKYLSLNIQKFTEIYGGERIHNLIRGLAAYNSGFGNASKWYGIPVIQETIDYIRKIMVNADKLQNEARRGY